MNVKKAVSGEGPILARHPAVGSHAMGGSEHSAVRGKSWMRSTNGAPCVGGVAPPRASISARDAPTRLAICSSNPRVSTATSPLGSGLTHSGNESPLMRQPTISSVNRCALAEVNPRSGSGLCRCHSAPGEPPSSAGAKLLGKHVRSVGFHLRKKSSTLLHFWGFRVLGFLPQASFSVL